MSATVGDTYDKKGACLKCGAETDKATQVVKDGDLPRQPNAGDLSLCAYCGHVTVFTAEGTLRQPTKEEAFLIEHDPVIAALQAAQKKAKRH